MAQPNSINNNSHRQSLISYLDDEEEEIIEENNPNNQNENAEGGANFVERVQNVSHPLLRSIGCREQTEKRHSFVCPRDY